MITATLDHFHEKAHRIMRLTRATLEAKFQVPPERLSGELIRDPDTGMVVLYACLDHGYLLRHNAQPFQTFLSKNLLHDLETVARVPAFPSNSDGVRIAFVLNQGNIKPLPTKADFPEAVRGLLQRGVGQGGRAITAMWGQHVMIGGMTGSGKSALLKSIVYQALLDGHQIAIADPLAKSFNMLRGHPSLLTDMALSADDAPRLIDAVADEVRRRRGLFESADGHPEDLAEYNALARKRGLPELQRLVVILDEFNDLVQATGGAGGDFAQVAADIARTARGFGLTLVVAAQDWTKESAGAVRGQCELRIAFKVRERYTSQVLIGCQDATRLRTPGRAFVDGRGMMQAYWLDKALLAGLADQGAGLRLSQNEMRIMLWLHANHSGKATEANLAQYPGLGRNEVRRLLGEWEKRGWVRKDPARANGRYLTVEAIDALAP